jgi:radical SAM-linked protein
MRVRLRFTKLGKVRFTSHRDVARLWERALRRAQLPVASTEGFSPRAKMHFGLALPTGHESLGEYLDVDFRPDEAATVDIESLPEQLSPLLPIGLEVETAAVIERSGLSLQEAVISCSWRIGLVGPIDPPSPGPEPDREIARAAVAALLAADRLPVTRERKGKVVEDDIRPAVLELAVADATEPGDPHRVTLECRLATQPRGIRPAELVATLSTFAATALDEGPVVRTHQWIALDGALAEPLPPGATRAAHAEARAS